MKNNLSRLWDLYPSCMGKKRAGAEISYFLADLGIFILLSLTVYNFYHKLRSWLIPESNLLNAFRLKNFYKFGSAVWAFWHYR